MRCAATGGSFCQTTYCLTTWLFGCLLLFVDKPHPGQGGLSICRLPSLSTRKQKLLVVTFYTHFKSEKSETNYFSRSQSWKFSVRRSECSRNINNPTQSNQLSKSKEWVVTHLARTSSSKNGSENKGRQLLVLESPVLLGWKQKQLRIDISVAEL